MDDANLRLYIALSTTISFFLGHATGVFMMCLTVYLNERWNR